MPSDDVIQFFCSSCGKKYRVPGKLGGKKSKCKDCGAEMRVPDKPPTPAQAKPAESTAPAKPTASFKPPTPEPEEDDAPIGLLEDKPTPKMPTRSASHRPALRGASPPPPPLHEPDVPEEVPEPTVPGAGFELAQSPAAVFASAPAHYHVPQVSGGSVFSGLSKALSMVVGISIPLGLIALALVGIFVSGGLMLIIFGLILLVVGFVFIILASIQYLVIGFRELGGTMWLTFLPFLGIFVVFRYWDDLGGPIIRSFLASLVACAGMFCLIFGMMAVAGPRSAPNQGPSAFDPYAFKHPVPPSDRPTPYWRQSPGGSNNRSATHSPPPPPPPPPVPLLTAADLQVAGQGLPENEVSSWPAFVAPDSVEASGEVVEYMGYRLELPHGFTVKKLTRTEDGMDAYIWGAVGTGRSGIVHFSMRPLARRADGTPIVPSWREALGAAGVVNPPQDTQHGTIGRLPFVRTASAAVATGRENGRVVYVGQPGAAFPVQIVFTFETYPRRNGLALACEALVRSIRITDVVMADAVRASQADVHEPLAPPLSAGAVPWPAHVTGMLAFPETEGIRVRETSRDGTFQANIETTPQRQGQIELVFTPLDIPFTGVWPVQLAGPMRDWPDGFQRRHDSVVYAYGGAVSYVRLWDNAVFVRVDHGLYAFDTGKSQQAVSYYGCIGDYRVDIRVLNEVSGRVTLSELERYLYAARLATAGELLEHGARAGWLREALGPAGHDFPLAGGYRGADVLALDPQGRLGYASGYDAELGQRVRDFGIYPEMDAQDLDRYDTWQARAGADQHLGREVTMGDFQFHSLTDLGQPRRQTQTRVEWLVQTNAGELGLEMELIPLRESDADLLTPIVAGGRVGEVQFRLGRRLMRPSEAPEVGYLESGGLRLWRFKMAPVRGMDVGRCYYAALVPGHMLVVSATYALSQPHQLDAFDAAVQSIDYRPLVAD